MAANVARGLRPETLYANARERFRDAGRSWFASWLNELEQHGRLVLLDDGSVACSESRWWREIGYLSDAQLAQHISPETAIALRLDGVPLTALTERIEPYPRRAGLEVAA